MKMQKEWKNHIVVWPAPSSKFLKMACGPKNLATPRLRYSVQVVLNKI